LSSSGGGAAAGVARATPLSEPTISPGPWNSGICGGPLRVLEREPDIDDLVVVVDAADNQLDRTIRHAVALLDVAGSSRRSSSAIVIAPSPSGTATS
jgi:hypothetical protein